jgi:hypothetical protein
MLAAAGPHAPTPLSVFTRRPLPGPYALAPEAGILCWWRSSGKQRGRMSRPGWKSCVRRSLSSTRCPTSSRSCSGTSAEARRCASGTRAGRFLAGCYCIHRRTPASDGWPCGPPPAAEGSGAPSWPRCFAAASRRARYLSKPSAQITPKAARHVLYTNRSASCPRSISRMARKAVRVRGSGFSSGDAAIRAQLSLVICSASLALVAGRAPPVSWPTAHRPVSAGRIRPGLGCPHTARPHGLPARQLVENFF